jgi:hypothetical protein
MAVFDFPFQNKPLDEDGYFTEEWQILLQNLTTFSPAGIGISMVSTPSVTGAGYLVDGFDSSEYLACFYFYEAHDSPVDPTDVKQRAGILFATWKSGGSANPYYTEYTARYINDPSDLVFLVTNDGLVATATATYTINAVRIMVR